MYVRYPKGYGGGDFWGQLRDAPPVARIPIPITFHPDFLWPLWNEIKMRSRCFPRAHPHPFHQSWSSLKPFSSKLMIVHHTTSAKTNFQLNRNESYTKNHEVHSSYWNFHISDVTENTYVLLLEWRCKGPCSKVRPKFINLLSFILQNNMFDYIINTNWDPTQSSS